MKHIHVHLTRDAPATPSVTPKRPPTTVIKPTPVKTGGTKPRSAAPVKPAKPAGIIKPQAGTGRPPPPSPSKPQHQPNTKPPSHTPITVHATGALKHATSLVHHVSNAIERNTSSVADEGSISTKKTRGGVTTWGGADPNKVVPKSPIDQLFKKSKDAGTSEGARKAAQTRAHGGGTSHFPGTEGTHFAGKPIFNAQHYNTQADNHYNMAKSHGKQGGTAHNNAAKLHSEASRLNKQATVTGRPEHVAAAKAATSKANAASKRLGHVFHRNRDAGTSEGARKAAATRKSHGGHPAISPDMKDMTEHQWKPAMVQHYNKHFPHASQEGGATVSRAGGAKGPVFAVEHQGKYYVSGKQHPIPSNPDKAEPTPSERALAKHSKYNK